MELGKEIELWSIKEGMIYPVRNTRYTKIGTVWILTTPTGEPLVVRLK